MKAAGKIPGRVHVPYTPSSVSAEQGAQSVEIDLSDVALAPDEGPPPVPLTSKDGPESSGVPRQDTWSEGLRSSSSAKCLSTKGSLSQFEEISPWHFQESDGSGSWSKSRSRQVRGIAFDAGGMHLLSLAPCLTAHVGRDGTWELCLINVGGFPSAHPRFHPSWTTGSKWKH